MQTPGNSEGQESLVRCSIWGCRQSDATEQLHNITNRSEVKAARSCPTLRPHGQSTEFSRPERYPLSLLQGIFPTQGWNPGLLHCRWILYQLSHKGSPTTTECSINVMRLNHPQPILPISGPWRNCLPRN